MNTLPMTTISACAGRVWMSSRLTSTVRHGCCPLPVSRSMRKRSTKPLLPGNVIGLSVLLSSLALRRATLSWSHDASTRNVSGSLNGCVLGVVLDPPEPSFVHTYWAVLSDSSVTSRGDATVVVVERETVVDVVDCVPATVVEVNT